MERPQACAAATLVAVALLFPSCESANSPAQPTTPTPVVPVDQPIVLTGNVVESGTRTPVVDARVCMHIPDNCAQTQQDGSYRLVLTSSVGNCPTVFGQDFEPRQGLPDPRTPRNNLESDDTTKDTYRSGAVSCLHNLRR